MNSRLIYIAAGLVGLVAIAFIMRSNTFSTSAIGGDRFASILYMGIWASLIGAALLTRPGSLANTLKQSVAWIAIFLVAMAGYSYRYELQDVASRITGGLVPGSPISITNNNGRHQVTLIRSANGHFSANAKINGIPITFLVDTGASDIVLTNRDANRVGLNTQDLVYSNPVSTANGMTTTARTRINELTLGNITQTNLTVMVAQPSDLQASLLGMRFINRLRGFEIRGDRMILTQ